MHKLCCYLMLLGGLLLLAGCGQSGDSMVKEQIDKTNELAEAIESDSAEADIEAIQERLKELAKKIAELPEEERNQLFEKHKEKLLAALARLAKAQAGKVGPKMEGLIKSMRESMQKGMPEGVPKMPGD